METNRVIFRHPQGKPGWRCLYQEHLCGMKHRLSDYVPESAEEIVLDLFGFSQVLV